MTTLLKITASLYGADGQSSRLADHLVEVLRASEPDLQVIERDLSLHPVPHLDAERFAAFIARPEDRTSAQQDVAAFSDGLIDELRRADVLVLGLPMYNLGLPSQLKAYLDHVARAGVTFRYTAEGPMGLLTGKRAYVLATRGGAYQGTPADTETAYIRQILGFLGIREVEFVYAEGLAMGAERRDAALADARERIQSLAAPMALAA